MSRLAHLSAAHRWAAGGWAFFIAENTLLSENRTWIIEQLGNENYHAVYGLGSTLATASIGYAYYAIKKMNIAETLKPNRPGALVLGSLGLVLASQALPRMQIPIQINDTANVDTQASDTTTTRRFQVRCPFDFNETHTTSQIHGMERITRHVGLWSFGFVGLGQACLQTNPALRVWWMGPAAVAWLGGLHHDSRMRRGMGGHLDPNYESQTSCLPFAAMLTGKQGDVGSQIVALMTEIKPLNAGVAVLAATLWVVSRGRAR
jgi:hypothetical protein